MLQNVTQNRRKPALPNGALARTLAPITIPVGAPAILICSPVIRNSLPGLGRNRLRPPPSPEQVVAAHQLTDFKGQMGLFGQNPHAATNAQSCTISHKDAQTTFGRHPAPRTQNPAPSTPPVRLDRALSPGTPTRPAEAPLAIIVKAPASRSRKSPWSRCRASLLAGRPASARVTSHRIPSCERP